MRGEPEDVADVADVADPTRASTILSGMRRDDGLSGRRRAEEGLMLGMAMVCSRIGGRRRLSREEKGEAVALPALSDDATRSMLDDIFNPPARPLSPPRAPSLLSPPRAPCPPSPARAPWSGSPAGGSTLRRSLTACVPPPRSSPPPRSRDRSGDLSPLSPDGLRSGDETGTRRIPRGWASWRSTRGSRPALGLVDNPSLSDCPGWRTSEEDWRTSEDSRRTSRGLWRGLP